MHVATSGETHHDRAAAQLGCHHARRGSSHDQLSRTPRISRPQCSSHAITSAVSLPVILIDQPHWGVVVQVDARAALDRAAPSRAGDPPDTPPPILRS